MDNPHKKSLRWYTYQTGPQPTFTTEADFSPALLREASQFRQRFELQNQSFGIDTTQNNPEGWQAIRISDTAMGLDHEVYVAISTFEWGRVEPSQFEGVPRPLVPRFTTHTHLALPLEQIEQEEITGLPNVPDQLTVPEGLKVFHSPVITIEYHSRHPIFEPRLYISGKRPDDLMEIHHWFDDGRLCIAPASDTNQGWDKIGRSTTRWFDLAIAWSLWHVRRFKY